MAQSRRIKINTLGNLEELVNEQGIGINTPSPPITLVDEEGKEDTLPPSMTFVAEGRELSADEFAVAIFSLVSGGLIPITDDIERQLGKKLKMTGGYNQPAAINGYPSVITGILPAMKLSVEPLVQLELLIQEMAKIKRITDVKPTQKIHNLVFYIIASFENAGDVMKGIRTYRKNTESKPTPEVAQELYKGVCSSDFKGSLPRAQRFYKLFNIPPILDGAEVLVEEFVRKTTARKKLEVQELLKPSRFGFDYSIFEVMYIPTATIALQNIASYYPDGFITLMEEHTIRLQHLEDYSNKRIDIMKKFYGLAAEHRLPLSERIKSNIPRTIVFPLVTRIGEDPLSTYRDAVYDMLKSINSANMYTPNKEAFSSAFDEAFRFLYEGYLTPISREPGDREVAPPSKVTSAILRSNELQNLALYIGVELSNTSLDYVNRIRVYRPQKS